MKYKRDKSAGAIITKDTSCEGDYNQDVNENVDIDMICEDSDSSIVEENIEGNDKIAYRYAGCHANDWFYEWMWEI